MADISDLQPTFDLLFGQHRSITNRIRQTAEPLAREHLGRAYTDGNSAWFSWDVHPVYTDGTLTALDLVAITHIDRDPHTRRTIRVQFEDPTAPITQGLRSALFAQWNEVFPGAGKERRYAFTRLALGRDDKVSWSSSKDESMSIADARKVLDALKALNV